MTKCEAKRYGTGACSESPPKFRVVYRSRRTAPKVIDEHLACFVHGVLEVERHHGSSGIALCDLEQVR